MAPSVAYHCPCLSADPVPPPPNMPSSSYSFHPLHELFFCEECDAVRCNRCVSVEVSGYHCPNCLFEVPSASVRAEKNRCARNCFMCPNCRNTLSVVPSDPPDVDDGRSLVGEPPFFLYCNFCRWDSAEVDITFEKPTGLAAQLQKFEDAAPESLEFERLKEHFEPFLRASSSSAGLSGHSHAAHSHHTPANPITAAASSALARDIPGVAKYTPAGPPRGRRDKGTRDEISEYRTRVEVGGTKDAANVDFMRRLEEVSQVAALSQRWTNSWTTTLRSSELKPLRIPLHSKKTKRCPTCRHILIKPEQKAQSVRFKIKLVAANYLPAMTVAFPLTQDAARQRGAGSRQAPVEDTSGLHAGGTYPFHLALTNPLYDPIQVRLAVQRQVPPPSMTVSSAPAGSPEKARRPPFAVSLPQSAFPVAAFAEAWEYEDDEDMFGGEDDGFGGGGLDRERSGIGGKGKTVGVVERRANVTVVGGEVVIGKDARGPVKFNMLVSYTYRSDDPLAEDDVRATPSSRKEKVPEMKTFTFYTVVELGMVVPREVQVDVDN
ncbi:dynactin p62 family-domain-containing protein [Russula brevipes]|nr:dynactin p62 family-domain-containing protein [Russula brevipes]